MDYEIRVMSEKEQMIRLTKSELKLSLSQENSQLDQKALNLKVLMKLRVDDTSDLSTKFIS